MIGDSIPRQRYRQAIELLAILAVLADATLTRLVVGSGHAVEAAPGSAWLIDAYGFPVWAATATALVVATLGVARYADRYDPLGWLVRGVALLPLYGAYSNATNPWPATVAWGDVGGVAGAVLAVVAIAAIAPYTPRVWRECRRRLAAVSIDRHDRPLVVASVFLLVASAALAGVPASVFGPGAPAESVDRASAASGTVLDDMEDQSFADWETNTGMQHVTSPVYQGDYAVNYPATNDVRQHTFDSMSTTANFSTYLNIHNFDGSAFYLFATDSANTKGHNVKIATDGSILAGPSTSETDSGADISTDKWYRFKFANNNYSSDTFDLVVKTTAGKTVTTMNDVSFDGNIGSADKIWYDHAYQANFSVDYIVKGNKQVSQRVSGQVTDTDGNAIADASVTITDSNGKQVADLTTNSSGGYSTNLSDGDYTITVSKTNYETESKSISVSGSAVTQDFSLAYTGDQFDYTLGMCYEGDAQFHASTADADFFRYYLTDGTHPDSKLPIETKERGTKVCAQNGPTTGFSAVYGIIATGLGFNYEKNVTTTVTDPDASNYTWTVRSEIETDRAYWDIQGIDPSAARPYDQFIVDPPFNGSGDDQPCRTTDGTTETATPGATTEKLPLRVWYYFHPADPQAGEEVTFYGKAVDDDGGIDKWIYRFPNGDVKRGKNVTHTFAANGTYPVELEVVTNIPDGPSISQFYSYNVTVGNVSDGTNQTDPDNLPPTVLATYEPLAPETGESVAFQADANDTDGSIKSISWNIGGRTVAAGQSVDLTFSSPGTRQITVAVTDDDNATARYRFSLYVRENTTDTGWTADDPTALGTCSLPGDNGTTQRGILLEYWDPTYETVALHTNVTYDGTTYDIDKTFAQPKGYYFGCVGTGEDVEPGDAAANAAANTSVEFANGSTAAFNDTGIDDFSPENALGGSSGVFGGGGGGGLIGPDAGAGAPTWLTAVPALAAIAYVAYRRRTQGGGGGGTAGGAGASAGGSGGGILGRFGG